MLGEKGYSGPSWGLGNVCVLLGVEFPGLLELKGAMEERLFGAFLEVLNAWGARKYFLLYVFGHYQYSDIIRTDWAD